MLPAGAGVLEVAVPRSGRPAAALEHVQLVGVGIAQRPQVLGVMRTKFSDSTGRCAATQPAARSIPAPTSPVPARSISRVISAKKRSESVSPCTSASAVAELVARARHVADHAVVGEQPAVLLERMGVLQASAPPLDA